MLGRILLLVLSIVPTPVATLFINTCYQSPATLRIYKLLKGIIRITGTCELARICSTSQTTGDLGSICHFVNRIFPRHSVTAPAEIKQKHLAKDDFEAEIIERIGTGMFLFTDLNLVKWY